MAAQQRAAVNASERTAAPPLKKRHFISLSYPRRNFRESCGPHEIALSQTAQPPAPETFRGSGAGCPVCLLTRASNGPARLPTPAFRGSGLRAPSLRAHSGGAVPDFHGLPVYRTRRIGFSRLFHNRESKRRVSRPKCAAGDAGARRCLCDLFSRRSECDWARVFAKHGLIAGPACILTGSGTNRPRTVLFPRRRLSSSPKILLVPKMADDPAVAFGEPAVCKASSI